MTSSADENERIVREYVQGIFDDNTYKEELVSDDFVAYANGKRDGASWTLEKRKAVTSIYHEAFPDISCEVEETIATDDKVVVHLRLTGTHEGVEFSPDGRIDETVKPTGDEIDVSGVGIFKVEDEKIVEVGWFVDKTQLMTQLGVLPN